MDAIPPKTSADHRRRRTKVNLAPTRRAENSAAAAAIAGAGAPTAIKGIPHFTGLFAMARRLLTA
jgi:hypothetical protein